MQVLFCILYIVIRFLNCCIHLMIEKLTRKKEKYRKDPSCLLKNVIE